MDNYSRPTRFMVMDRIPLLVYDNQESLCRAFCRPQEHYENPKFKGKIFSMEEFREWYKKRHDGEFTYFEDWNGFNVPSRCLSLFICGEFHPLTVPERHLVQEVQLAKWPCYVIGVHTDTPNPDRILKHEVAHAMYYLSSMYRSQVESIMHDCCTNAYYKAVESYRANAPSVDYDGAYHEDALFDECHAYALDPDNAEETFGVRPPSGLSEELLSLWDECFERSNGRWPPEDVLKGGAEQ